MTLPSVFSRVAVGKDLFDVDLLCCPSLGGSPAGLLATFRGVASGEWRCFAGGGPGGVEPRKFFEG